MTSKNGGDSWGNGRPMEELTFCYDRHEEITRYLDEGCALSYNCNVHALLKASVGNFGQWLTRILNISQ